VVVMLPELVILMVKVKVSFTFAWTGATVIDKVTAGDGVLVVVLVKVAVGGVPVTVGVEVFVAVPVTVEVWVGVGVCVAVAVAVEVSAGVSTWVSVAVGVAVRVSVTGSCKIKSPLWLEDPELFSELPTPWASVEVTDARIKIVMIPILRMKIKTLAFEFRGVSDLLDCLSVCMWKLFCKFDCQINYIWSLSRIITPQMSKRLNMPCNSFSTGASNHP
jgi:hypothetical protein